MKTRIKSMKLLVTIDGIDADYDALTFLKGWLREATKAGLLGHERDRFRYRNKSEKDIRVKIEDKSVIGKLTKIEAADEDNQVADLMALADAYASARYDHGNDDGRDVTAWPDSTEPTNEELVTQARVALEMALKARLV